MMNFQLLKKLFLIHVQKSINDVSFCHYVIKEEGERAMRYSFYPKKEGGYIGYVGYQESNGHLCKKESLQLAEVIDFFSKNHQMYLNEELFISGEEHKKELLAALPQEPEVPQKNILAEAELKGAKPLSQLKFHKNNLISGEEIKADIMVTLSLSKPATANGDEYHYEGSFAIKSIKQRVPDLVTCLFLSGTVEINTPELCKKPFQISEDLMEVSFYCSLRDKVLKACP